MEKNIHRLQKLWSGVRRTPSAVDQLGASQNHVVEDTFKLKHHLTIRAGSGKIQHIRPSARGCRL